jgi:hypothetical protein
MAFGAFAPLLDAFAWIDAGCFSGGTIAFDAFASMSLLTVA